MLFKRIFSFGALVATLALVVNFGFATLPAAAQGLEDCQNSPNPDTVERCIQNQAKTSGKDCVKTSFKFNGTNCVDEARQESANKNPIYVMATTIMRFMSILVGIAVTGGIIYGGILWSTSQGNPAQTQKATAVIFNAILGLIMYILMFAIINFLVPGGLFQR